MFRYLSSTRQHTSRLLEHLQLISMTGKLSVSSSLVRCHDFAHLALLPELRILTCLSTLYFIWTNSRLMTDIYVTKDPNAYSQTTSGALNRPESPRSFEGKDTRKTSTPLTSVDKGGLGYIWMSVPKNYRCVRPICMATWLTCSIQGNLEMMV